MSWNISNDGRVTRLDDGPIWPWWIGPGDDGPEHTSGEPEQTPHGVSPFSG